MAFYLESLCYESVGGRAITRDSSGREIKPQWRRVKASHLPEPYRYETLKEARDMAWVIGARVVNDSGEVQ